MGSAMPATLDMFFSDERHEEKKQPKPYEPEEEKEKPYKKIYIVTENAYEKYCSKCEMLLKAEEVESPMFKYRVFCKAEYCVRR